MIFKRHFHSICFDRDVKARRDSYARAMDFRVKSTSVEIDKPQRPSLKPRRKESSGVSECNGPPVVPRRKEW